MKSFSQFSPTRFLWFFQRNLPFTRRPALSPGQVALTNKWTSAKYLSHLVRCELSQIRYHSHSLLFSSYLCRIKWKNSSCSARHHQLLDLTHLPDCPTIEPFHCPIFGTTSIFHLWSKSCGVAHIIFLCSHPSKGVR